MSSKLLLLILPITILTVFSLPRFSRSYVKLQPILRPKLASPTRRPRELIFPPCELDGIDIALCMAFLVVRICSAAVWRLITFSFQAQVSGKLDVVCVDDADESDGPEYHLPDAQRIILTMPLQADLGPQLRQYRAAIRQSAYTSLSSAHKLHPLHRPILLSAITMPAALLVLASADCPIQPLGSVNLRNVFEVIDHEACTTLLNNSSSANKRETTSPRTDCHVQAELSNVVLPVRRGWEVSIIINIVAKGSGRAIYKQTFVLLHNEKHRLADRPAPRDPAPATNSQVLGSAMRVSGSDPYLWAKLCRDYNPIHTAYPLARLFGFRQRIMHGNHVAAKAVQAYIDAYPEEAEAVLRRAGPSKATVAFKRPVLVGSKLTVNVGDAPAESGNGFVLQVISKGRTAVEYIYAST